MSKRKISKEESLFHVDGTDIDVPPSPLEQEEKRRRAKAREREQAILKTKDERAASAGDIMAEWVKHVEAQGLSQTRIPTGIRDRVSRKVRSLIRDEYLYKEITYALMVFTVRDLRDRKNMPNPKNLEVYARQYRGENVNEKAANDAERERLRRESLSRGQVPTTGNARQNSRDASYASVYKVFFEEDDLDPSSSSDPTSQGTRYLEPGKGPSTSKEPEDS